MHMGKSKPSRNYIDAAFMLFEPGNNNEVSFTQQPAVATRAGFYCVSNLL